jgi:hypothetical protein
MNSSAWRCPRVAHPKSSPELPRLWETIHYAWRATSNGIRLCHAHLKSRRAVSFRRGKRQFKKSSRLKLEHPDQRKSRTIHDQLVVNLTSLDFRNTPCGRSRSNHRARVEIRDPGNTRHSTHYPHGPCKCIPGARISSGRSCPTCFVMELRRAPIRGGNRRSRQLGLP